MAQATRMGTEELTSRQRARLRSLAHHLKPVVHVGSGGVNETVLQAVVDAFNTRELLKVRVLDGAPEDPRTTGDSIAAGVEGAHIAQTIGRTVVVYRAFAENPEIKLPG